MMKIYEDVRGEDYLCSWDNILWNLTYDILLRFQCPVIFKTFGPDVTCKIDFNIDFFVPKNHPNTDMVIQYIKQELEHNERPNTQYRDGVYLWGITLTIYKFNGIEPHLQHEECQKMATNCLKYLLDNINKT